MTKANLVHYGFVLSLSFANVFTAMTSKYYTKTLQRFVLEKQNSKQHARFHDSTIYKYNIRFKTGKIHARLLINAT